MDHDDPALAEAMNRLYATVLSLLQQRKDSRRVDIETDAIAIWSMIHGYISMRLDRNLMAAEDSVSGLHREGAIMLSLIDGIGGGRHPQPPVTQWG